MAKIELNGKSDKFAQYNSELYKLVNKHKRA